MTAPDAISAEARARLGWLVCRDLSHDFGLGCPPPMNQSSVLIVGSLASTISRCRPARSRTSSAAPPRTRRSPRRSSAPVRLVGVVGEDFPETHLDDAARSAASTPPASSAPTGKTFRWRGRYSTDLSSRETLDTQLNVFADFRPKIPAAFKTTPFVLLGNIHPALQLEVLAQVEQAEARRRRHDELLDHRRAEAPRRDADEGRPPRHQRRRGARALRHPQPREGRRRHPQARPDAPHHQARRARRALFDDDGRVLRARATRSRRSSTRPAPATRSRAASSGYLARIGDARSTTPLRRAMFFGSALGSFCVEGIGPTRLLDVTQGRSRRPVSRRSRRWSITAALSHSSERDDETHWLLLSRRRLPRAVPPR